MKISSLFILLFAITFSSQAQLKDIFDKDKKKPLLKVRKAGPYLGVQKGKYFNVEIGAEMQFKKVKLIKPPTYAINMGFDYNLFENVLGYSAGFWYKQGRLNLTYGGTVVFRSDFNSNRVGGGPALGFKLLGFHLQTGYNFLTPSTTFRNTNQLYISLRYVLVNTRDYKWRKRNKRK